MNAGLSVPNVERIHHVSLPENFGGLNDSDLKNTAFRPEDPALSLANGWPRTEE